jgi:hypothetical protein
MELHFAPEPNPHLVALACAEGGWPVDRVAKRLAALPVADRQEIMNAMMAAAPVKTDYDSDWVDMDNDICEE